MVAPVFVGREASLLAIEEAQMDNHTVIALTQRDSTVDNPKIGDFLTIGRGSSSWSFGEHAGWLELSPCPGTPKVGGG